MSKLNSLFLLLSFLAFVACSDDKVGEDAIDTSKIQTVSDFVDERDGHVYKCVQIGDQIWMAENLAYYLPEGGYAGCYTWDEDLMSMDKIDIPNETFIELAKEVLNEMKDELPLNDQIGIEMSIEYINYGMTQEQFISMMKPYYPAYIEQLEVKLDEFEQSYIFQSALKHTTEAESENGEYAKTYGYLYSLEAARKAVPEGWRLPSDEDWKKLEATLGMNASEIEKINAWRGRNAGDYLKVGGITGFDALYGGCNAYEYATLAQYFIRKTEGGYFWTSEESSQTVVDDSGKEEVVKLGIIREIAIFSSGIWRGTTRLDNGYRSLLYSVRCVKDVK